MRGNSILVVERSRDLSVAYERLLGEQVVVETLLAPVDVVAEARRARPLLLVLDLVPAAGLGFEALDRLREDAVAREIPVVVTTTSREMAEASLASYNVRAALVKPFNLDEFVALVMREVGQPTLHAAVSPSEEPAPGFAAVAERVLAADSRNIVFRWIQRLREEAPWRERDDLGLADLIDYAPVILKVLDVRLHYETPEDFLSHHPEATERARAHAQLRASQGIGFGAALREYALLREEIWSALRLSPASLIAVDEFFEVERAINGTLDAIVIATSAAFVEEASPPMA
jgi:CheY-like chemotaxis protein